jgi:hypothetical protein
MRRLQPFDTRPAAATQLPFGPTRGQILRKNSKKGRTHCGSAVRRFSAPGLTSTRAATDSLAATKKARISDLAARVAGTPLMTIPPRPQHWRSPAAEPRRGRRRCPDPVRRRRPSMRVDASPQFPRATANGRPRLGDHQANPFRNSFQCRRVFVIRMTAECQTERGDEFTAQFCCVINGVFCWAARQTN